MTILVVLIGILSATMYWPVNRWVAHHKGRTDMYCFWLLLMSCIISGALLLFFKQPFFVGGIWILGAIIGLAYAIGLRLTMYCLRWGSAGITVTMNNMGLIWPVVAGIAFLNPRMPTITIIVGILGVCAALVMIGLSKPSGDSLTQPANSSDHTMSLLTAMLFLWVAAGVSMTAQAVAGNQFPQSSLSIVFVMSFVAWLLFIPSFIRNEGRFRPVEFVPGVLGGIIQITTCVCILVGVKRIGAELIFPLIIASPIIIMLFVGHFILREHLTRLAWIACFIGVSGLVLLSVT